MATLLASVGDGGRNHREDVVTVQELLKAQGCDPGTPDGICGPHTLAAIRRFQSRFMKWPDGRIDPGRTTWAHLVAGSGGAAAAAAGTPTATPATPSGTSGGGTTGAAPAEEWSGNSARWSQEKKLRSMTPSLRPKVADVVQALRDRGFEPKIFYGWRSVAVQERLFREGHTTVHFSFHNAQRPDGTPNAYAADIIDRRYAWRPEAQSSGFWRALGEEAKRRGLFWGGDWVNFKDWAHVQLVANSELGRVRRESGL